MPAFVQQFDLFDLSVAYDAITVYPKCDLGQEPQLVMTMNQCCKLIYKYIPGYATKEGKAFDASRGEVCDLIGIHQ